MVAIHVFDLTWDGFQSFCSDFQVIPLIFPFLSFSPLFSLYRRWCSEGGCSVLHLLSHNFDISRLVLMLQTVLGNQWEIPISSYLSPCWMTGTVSSVTQNSDLHLNLKAAKLVLILNVRMILLISWERQCRMITVIFSNPNGTGSSSLLEVSFSSSGMLSVPRLESSKLIADL